MSEIDRKIDKYINIIPRKKFNYVGNQKIKERERETARERERERRGRGGGG